MAYKVGPALAVGTPIGVKPAPATPLVALLLGDLPAEHRPACRLVVGAAGAERGGGRAGRGLRLPVVSFNGSGCTDRVAHQHVLHSDALRPRHRLIAVALTRGYARARPITDTDRHRIVRMPGVPEPVWLLDARVTATEALFRALMAVPSLQRKECRRLVLDPLPQVITAVPHHPITRLHGRTADDMPGASS